MKKNSLKIALLCINLFAFHNVFAEQFSDFQAANHPFLWNNGYIEVGAMGGWNRFYPAIDDTVTVVATPLETDTLTFDGRSNNFTVGGDVLFGVLFPHNPIFHSMSAGPAIFYQQSAFNGQVLQFGLPFFNNYSYQLEDKNTIFLAQGKVNFYNFFNHLSPFFTLGLGGNYNQTSYDETTLAPAIAPPNTERHLNTRHTVGFAGAIGGGIDFLITPNFGVNISDIFTYLGRLKTTTTGSQQLVLQEPISYNANSQNFLVGLSYRFQ